jgi:FkbM family methyltransferase
MNAYGQEPELRLLGALVGRLENRSMIDVGAERGGVAQGMLDAGVERLQAFEPHPDNMRTLRSRFGADARVEVHEYALSDSVGSAELHVSWAPNGSSLPFGHTLLERTDTAEIAWKDTIKVTCRSLGSLISSGEIPSRTGILKVDTEGNDLAVLRGMGPMDADVVMVEHWTDLPNGLGTCPWSIEDMVGALQPRGFGHFAFIVHRGEFVTMKWDDGDVERGAMGNLVFLHDRVLERLLPDLLDCAARLSDVAVRTGQMYMHAANKRLALIDELTDAAEARLRALEATTQTRSESADLDVSSSQEA